MSVNNLETPERGMNLKNRKPPGSFEPPEVEESRQRITAHLQERLAVARVAEPEGGFTCCSHCAQAFTRGRDAAIKAIEE